MSDASSKPFDPPFPGFAGFGPMMEQMESFKRLWSSMDVSSRLVPTLDIGELDKRIADLKAVEQWLNLNLGMLRGSIQGLEIQRGTLAAVQAFGSSFSVPGAWDKPASAPKASAPKASTPEPREPSEPPAPEGSARRPASEAASASSASPLPAGIDPSAWWNLLQSNFQQIAQAALASAPVPAASPSSTRPGTRTSARSPASQSASEPGRPSARKAPARKASAKPSVRKTPGGR